MVITMKFNDFDTKMRKFEESLDQYIPPDNYIIVRLDGRSFTKFTKKNNFQKPFDGVFQDAMEVTLMHLMDIGFRTVYGYSQSDEFSILLHIDDDTFNRKTRKINSIFASSAGAVFSLYMQQPVAFDSRVIPLPNIKLVCDYFDWRQEDAFRNALNSYCYWQLRKEGDSPSDAQAYLNKYSFQDKQDLLFSRGINFNNVTNWHKRGFGAYWIDIDKEGYNPLTEEKVTTTRRKLCADIDLPYAEEYRWFIKKLIE